MQRKSDPNAAAALVLSWVLAAAGGLLAVLFTAVGQGVGAVIGGCRWIGLTLPIYDQPWALVNQPSLAFSGQGVAFGYWFGGLFLCLIVALFTVGFVPRPKTMSWELAALQVAWSAAVIGLAWIPLLDPRDGHFSGYLRLNALPVAAVWIAPVMAGWVGLLPTARLLALARAAGGALPRWKRILVVSLHQALPIAVWVGVGLVLITSRGEAGATRIELTQTLFERLWPPVVAAAMPVLAALALAWTSIPRPVVTRLEGLRIMNVLPLLIVCVALGSMIVVLGRPLPDGRCGGLLWSAPDSRNNIRARVEPIEVFSVGTLRD